MFQPDRALLASSLQRGAAAVTTIRSENIQKY
jgi:hypothetical protein